jgi:GT2 family glycosyltransferase
MLSIIVLNYNRLHYTRQTIENLIAKTKVPHEFIFVDNGSIDGTREYLKSLEYKTNAVRVQYVFNEFNYGVAGGRNSGLLVAGGDYLMTIDDDILVPDNYDGYLIEACDKISGLGIVGVNVEKAKYKYPVVGVEGIQVRLKKKGNLGGACLCLPRRVFDRVGYFAPDFVYGGEDCDMHIRLCMLGLLSVYIVPSGKHIDKKENKDYEMVKKYAHNPSSKSYQRVGTNEKKYKKTQSVYVPYMEPVFETKHFDEAIKGKPK